jgi:hypothetical protein
MESIGKIAGKSVKGQTFLMIPKVTHEFQMRELFITFEIEVWSLLDLLEIMFKSKRIELGDIKALLKYLRYIRDLPYSSFEKDANKVFRDLLFFEYYRLFWTPKGLIPA